MSQNGSGGFCKKQTNKPRKQKLNYKNVTLLQRALGAATIQSSFHLLGVRGAVGAAEHHLPPSALGDATAKTCGCCCLAGSGTIHAGDLAGGCACSHGLVALQLLPHHLPLTCQLWTWMETERRHYTHRRVISSESVIALTWSGSIRSTCVAGRSGVAWLTVADGLTTLRKATLPMSAALPSAGQRPLPSITVLTLVAFVALAAVGLSLCHTQTVDTSGASRRKQRGWEEKGMLVQMWVFYLLVCHNSSLKLMNDCKSSISTLFLWGWWKVLEQLEPWRSPIYPHHTLKFYCNLLQQFLKHFIR